MKKLMILILVMFSLRLFAPEGRAVILIELNSPICISDPLLFSFQFVESSFDADTINYLGYAGILQEGQEMIDEANRICKIQDIPLTFSYPESALDSLQATQIWYIVQRYHNKEYHSKKACKIWNPLASVKYRKKIEQTLIDKLTVDWFLYQMNN
jgi:hypothetical protein